MNRTTIQFYIKKKGFTLVETLIAIAILVTAVLAPLAIAQSGIQGARYAQQQVTATFLAQEAVELVKYQAAYNLNTAAANWLQGLDACKTANCEVKGPRLAAGSVIGTCSSNVYDGTCLVYVNTGVNTYRSATAGIARTPYTRTIRIREVSAGREAEVTVVVSWRAPNNTVRTYEVKDYIYRWR